MGNRESVGVVTILVGVLLIIAATRGTLNKLWSDVVLGQKSTGGTGTAGNSSSSPAGTGATLFSAFPGTAGSPTLPTQ